MPVCRRGLGVGLRGLNSLAVRRLAPFAVLALLMVGAMYRPLLFSSVDAEIADARGVPVRFLSVAFMVLLAVTVSASVQVVGVLRYLTRRALRDEWLWAPAVALYPKRQWSPID